MLKNLSFFLLTGLLVSCSTIKTDISGRYISTNYFDTRVLILKNNNDFEYIVFNNFKYKDSIQNIDIVTRGEWKQKSNKIYLISDDDSFEYPIGEEGVLDTLQVDEITSFSFRKYKYDDTIFIKKVNACNKIFSFDHGVKSFKYDLRKCSYLTFYFDNYQPFKIDFSDTLNVLYYAIIYPKYKGYYFVNEQMTVKRNMIKQNDNLRLKFFKQ